MLQKRPSNWGRLWHMGPFRWCARQAAIELSWAGIHGLRRGNEPKEEPWLQRVFNVGNAVDS